MKKLMLLSAAAVAALAFVWPGARAEGAEEAAVRAALGNYLRAHATGQGEYHRKVFHPEAKLFAIRDGKFWQLTSEEYISRSPGKPPDDEAQRRRSIESVDVTGNAAVAKIVLDSPTSRITDYMSLLKVDGEWKIVNKIFYVEPKANQ